MRAIAALKRSTVMSLNKQNLLSLVRVTLEESSLEQKIAKRSVPSSRESGPAIVSRSRTPYKRRERHGAEW